MQKRTRTVVTVDVLDPSKDTEHNVKDLQSGKEFDKQSIQSTYW